MGLKNNWKTLVDDVDYASAEQINQIAEAVIDIEEEMEQQPDIPDVDLSEYVKRDEVFETGSFGWTDFHYDVEVAEWDNTYELSNNQINGGEAKFTIHCKGKTLGIDYTCDNTNASYIEINGVQYTSGSGSIPLTYMESDIIVYCSLAVFAFSNMTIQSIKGVTELEEQIGDIDTALDSILQIQNGLIGGDA
jgi:hypothetical protein